MAGYLNCRAQSVDYRLQELRLERQILMTIEEVYPQPDSGLGYRNGNKQLATYSRW